MSYSNDRPEHYCATCAREVTLVRCESCSGTGRGTFGRCAYCAGSGYACEHARRGEMHGR